LFRGPELPFQSRIVLPVVVLIPCRFSQRGRDTWAKENIVVGSQFEYSRPYFCRKRHVEPPPVFNISVAHDFPARNPGKM
jgi:hypothetical protein